MNLLLLTPNDIQDDGSVLVQGRQATHLMEILKIVEGSVVRVGIDNRWVGKGRVISTENVPMSTSGSCPKRRAILPEQYRVRLQLLHGDGTQIVSPSGSTCLAETGNLPVRHRPRIDILLGMPRPKVFDKVLQTLATLGVGRIIITPTVRVENGYFSSPKLSQLGIKEALRIGLEQASVDSLFPHVHIYASWKRCLLELKENFILFPSPISADNRNHEQEINPVQSSSSNPPECYHQLIVLHPDDDAPTLDSSSLGLSLHQGPVVIAIGPEGGLIDDEVEDLRKLGFHTSQLGTRILKVETAITTAIAQINLLLPQLPTSATTSSAPSHRKDLLPVSTVPCWCLPKESSEDIIVKLPIRGLRLKTDAQ